MWSTIYIELKKSQKNQSREFRTYKSITIKKERKMESLMLEMAKTISWIIVIGVLGLGIHVYGKVMAEKWRVRRKLTMQGVKGPPPSLFRGNVPEMQKIQSQMMSNSKHYSGDNIIAHDYTSSLFPYLDLWRKQYGIYAL